MSLSKLFKLELFCKHLHIPHKRYVKCKSELRLRGCVYTIYGVENSYLVFVLEEGLA